MFEREYEIKFWVRVTKENREDFDSVEKSLDRWASRENLIEGCEIVDRDVALNAEWE